MTSVLYDTAGPKARLRYRIYGVIGTIALVAIAAYIVYRMAVTGQFEARKWEFILYEQIQILLLDAWWATVSAFLVAAVLSLLFGLVFAAGRMSDHRWISLPATAVVEFFRAIPLLILIFILYFGLSRGLGLNISTFWALVLGLMLYNGSVLAEIFRGGVRALPKGQSEASYALGMRKTQVMTYVLMPQALRAMLPTIISQLVVVLKDTALGFLILYPELLYQARYLGGQTNLGSPILQVGLVIAVIYIAMCLLLSWLANYLERRTKRSRKVGPLEPTAAPDAEMEIVTAAPGGGAAPRT
ncbi:amino acid ABC transporter membrane protein 2, PAAT family [Pseudonocardia thermophila]|jgi:amine acid ABC transporter, permease protein, 3-TM region, His/Glu/Gln/Arg/opine family|uniref:Amino acid ABC transporter membrane protein 2, PAAT family n=1 Tax=Pseudonocardia thermophila TaxID=1848 RepID=A0A1M6QVT7_PSETH|nr:amino acid ABC transporter permease [Pseudonocardia thermophila]SHK24379.1 amino acid ABC transporter membrane protein 2, PAAT family [Pseudonocardia thermophila]